VVFFMLDVSGSMSDRDRKLAKTFFFWVVQGLRREYRSLETLFVAHTTERGNSTSRTSSSVSGTGGTVASTGLAKVREIIDARYNPGRCKHLPVLRIRRRQLRERCRRCAHRAHRHRRGCLFHRLRGGVLRAVAAAGHRTGKLFAELQAAGCAAGSYALNDFEDVWARCGISSPPKPKRPRAVSPAAPMSEGWQSYVRRIEELAARSGLEFHPVDFEAVPTAS